MEIGLEIHDYIEKQPKRLCSRPFKRHNLIGKHICYIFEIPSDNMWI